MTHPGARFLIISLLDILIGTALGLPVWTIILLTLFVYGIALGGGFLLALPLAMRGCTEHHITTVITGAAPLAYATAMYVFAVPVVTMFWFILWTYIASYGYSLVFGGE